MDDNERITVDFVFPPEGEAIPDPVKLAAASPHLGKCSGCGGKKYFLANEMSGDEIKGVPASRMYECADCGTYRLG